jgi:glycosyltransferase involved in cell wall biosynthesis
MKPRVCVVTAGHLSTCPRMLKAADALHAAGYQVRVVSTRHVSWAWQADLCVRKRRQWAWQVVDYDRASARGKQLTSGVRFRGAQAAARAAGPGRVPLAVGIRGYSRMHDELVSAIASEPADFVYGGTTGALAAVAAGAHRLGVRFGLDLEDFHSAEQTDEGSALAHALAERIESDVLPKAAFLTAGSPLIADAYAAKYRVRPAPIHNTFTINFATAPHRRGPLRLYWFSQTLGPGRGLEDVIAAVGRCGISAEFHLRARPIPPYAAALTTFQARVAPSLKVVFHGPESPDRMIELAQDYDLGVSTEDGAVLNHRLCLGNKIFTYLAAGTPVLLTATPAQARLAADLGAAATLYEPGDVDALATILQRWNGDPNLRCVAAHEVRAAARRRWHWEHANDRGALMTAFCNALG